MSATDEFLRAILEIAETGDVEDIYHEIEFKGFDKKSYLDTISKDDAKATLRIALVGATRGTKWLKLKDTGLDFNKLGYTEALAPGLKTTNIKTIARTTSVLGPEVVIALSRLTELKKRIETSEVPACLQFPAAATVQMTDKARKKHIAYCKAFSTLLRGTFSPTVYEAMAKDARPIKVDRQDVIDFLTQ